MAENENIGGIAVDIVGNYAPLAADLDSAVAAAAKAGQEIAESLNAGANAADQFAGAVTAASTGMGDFESRIAALVNSGSTLAEALDQVSAETEAAAQGIGTAGDAAEAAAQQLELFDAAIDVPYADEAGQLNLFATELEPIGPAAQQAAAGTEEFAHGAHDAGEAAQDAEHKTHEFMSSLLEVAGVALTVEALKSLIEQMVELNAEEERAGEGLAFMAGNMEEAGGKIEHLRDLAQELAVPFDEVARAAQQMAFRLTEASDTQIEAALHAASDAAKVSGQSFDQMSNALSRIALTGNVMPRMLTSIGVSMEDLATVMDVKIEDVKRKFQELDEGSRLQDLIAAMDKTRGATEAMANDTESQLTRTANAWKFGIADIGSAVTPMVTEIAPLVVTAAKAIGTAFIVVLDSLKIVGAAIGGLIYGIGATVVDLGKIVVAAMNNDVGGIIDASKRLAIDYKATWEGTSGAIKDNVAQMTASLDSLWKSTTSAAGANKDWEGSTHAVKAAQDELLPVVTNVRVATKDWVDLTAVALPDAAKQAANQVEATRVAIVRQGEAIEMLTKMLDAAIASNDVYNTQGKKIVQLQEELATATKKYYDLLGNPPDTAAAFQKQVAAAMTEAKQAIIDLLPPLQKVPIGVMDVEHALAAMGIQADSAGNSVTKIVRAYEDLGKGQHTLDQEDAAWAKISSTVDKLAKTDLPLVISLYNEHLAQLVKLHASQGEILAAQGQLLQLEIKTAEQSGTSATAQIVALEKVKLAQQVLYDQTHLLGDMYVGVINDILKGWESLGKSIADNIVDEKNWHDVWINGLKSIAKSILETLVGTAFKALEDSILKSTGLLDGLTASFNKLLGTAAGNAAGGAAGSVASSAGSAAGGGATVIQISFSGGGLLSGAGAIGAIASAIEGAFGLAQMSHLISTDGKIEENTRRLDIVFEKYANQDEWDRHNGLLGKFDMIFDRLGDVWNEIRTGWENTVAALGAVPQMALGGAVIGDGLRYLHDGEVVITRAEVPPLLNAGMLKGSGSGANYASASTVNSISGLTFNIYETANPRETARQLADTLRTLSSKFSPYGQ